MASVFTLEYTLKMARVLLQDAEKERYSDAELLDSLNMAITEMQRIRPDIPALFQPIQGFPWTTTSLNQGNLLPVDGKYFSPLVSFVTGWAELRDDEFATDNRAVTLLTRFQSQLTMGG